MTYDEEEEEEEEEEDSPPTNTNPLSIFSLLLYSYSWLCSHACTVISSRPLWEWVFCRYLRELPPLVCDRNNHHDRIDKKIVTLALVHSLS